MKKIIFCIWGKMWPMITKSSYRSHNVCFYSKLVINQIIPEDDGIYQCQAENQLGSVLAMARLIVVMSDNRPSAPRNVRADTMSSSAILLAWERPMYNSNKVIAYSVHYMKTEGEWHKTYSQDNTDLSREPRKSHRCSNVLWEHLSLSSVSCKPFLMKEQKYQESFVSFSIQQNICNCNAFTIIWETRPYNTCLLEKKKSNRNSSE